MKNYNFLMPEVKSISRATIVELFRRWQFWSILAAVLCLSIVEGLIIHGQGIIIVFIPFIIIFLYANLVQKEIRILFWKQFAEMNGWQYAYSCDPNQEKGIMFRLGRDRHISYCIEGVIDERRFRIFNYDFKIGSGKETKIYNYTVFAFKFGGTFPNIYLNNKNNSCGIKAGEAIPLPEEFENSFTLSAPKDYEIEALEIFTPDVLASLLDNKFNHDVEFVNQEMLVFSDG